MPKFSSGIPFIFDLFSGSPRQHRFIRAVSTFRSPGLIPRLSGQHVFPTPRVAHESSAAPADLRPGSSTRIPQPRPRLVPTGPRPQPDRRLRCPSTFRIIETTLPTGRCIDGKTPLLLPDVVSWLLELHECCRILLSCTADPPEHSRARRSRAKRFKPGDDESHPLTFQNFSHLPAAASEGPISYKEI